jgi:hypothetical protein
MEPKQTKFARGMIAAVLTAGVGFAGGSFCAFFLLLLYDRWNDRQISMVHLMLAPLGGLAVALVTVIWLGRYFWVRYSPTITDDSRRSSSWTTQIKR